MEFVGIFINEHKCGRHITVDIEFMTLLSLIEYEPLHKKTNKMLGRNQRRRSA